MEGADVVLNQNSISTQALSQKGPTRFGGIGGLLSCQGLGFVTCFSEGSTCNYLHVFVRFPKQIWAPNQGAWQSLCFEMRVAEQAPLSPTPPAASLC